jgi:cytoskeletal protein CcmA (bactofilin family)
MNEQTQRRFIERDSAGPTVLGAQSIFTGDLQAKGPLVVYGEVRGDADIDGSLSLAAGAHWQGNVRVNQAVVEGSVTGSLIVAGKLEIGHRAVIRGRVCAQTIAIAKGAIVDGEIEITSGAALHEFEEKRRSS